MAIALNNTYRASTATSANPSVVPAASVWDAAEITSKPNPAFRCGDNVRTLRDSSRTVRRENIESYSRSGRSASHDYAAAMSTRRSSYLLGGLFGCALFVGTVFAGMSGLAEEGAVYGGQPQTVQAGVAQ